jgi:hypothetical protein
MAVKIVLDEEAENMRVALCQRDEDKKFMFRVFLRSAKKTYSGPLSSFADVEVGVGSDLRKHIETAGGALAEYQNERYKDNHDPEQCARFADKLFVGLATKLKEKGLFG